MRRIPTATASPGLPSQITGIVTGVRDSAQRDWKQYATTGARSQRAALEFDVPGAFDLQENILHVSQCGTGCGLLATGAAASKAPGKVTFSFIGKTLGSSRVAAVVAGHAAAEPPERSDDLPECAEGRPPRDHRA